MNRKAIVLLVASSWLVACEHQDASSGSRPPLGATEMQTTSSAAREPAPSTAPAMPPPDNQVSDDRSATTTTVAPPEPTPVSPAGSPRVARPAATVAVAPIPPSAGNRAPTSAPDRSQVALTPMDQGNGAVDLEITRTIRRAVMADGSLSFMAKNVAIITLGSKVVLRGNVKTEKERASIESRASATSGVLAVDDQLVVKP